MIGISLIVFILLGIASIIDLYTKKVPAIFLTGIIFITLIVLSSTATSLSEMTSLLFGLFGLVFAYLIFEAGFIGGIADVKFITIMSMLLLNFNYFIYMMVGILCFGLFYKMFFIIVLKHKLNDEIPFLPCLLAVYLVLLLIGGLI